METVVIPKRDLVNLLQDGRITFLQYVMNSGKGREFVEWCKSHSVEPDNNAAEFYCEMTEIDEDEHGSLFIDDPDEEDFY